MGMVLVLVSCPENNLHKHFIMEGYVYSLFQFHTYFIPWLSLTSLVLFLSMNSSKPAPKLFGFLVLLFAIKVAKSQNTQLITVEGLLRIVEAPNDNQVILDVRTDDEVRPGVILGAIQIDYYQKDFRRQLGLQDRNKTYYVYCHTGGGRSAETTKIMGEMGFENVYHG